MPYIAWNVPFVAVYLKMLTTRGTIIFLPKVPDCRGSVSLTYSPLVVL